MSKKRYKISWLIGCPTVYILNLCNLSLWGSWIKSIRECAPFSLSPRQPTFAQYSECSINISVLCSSILKPILWRIKWHALLLSSQVSTSTLYNGQTWPFKFRFCMNYLRKLCHLGRLWTDLAEIWCAFYHTLGHKSTKFAANSVHRRPRKDVYYATFEGKTQQPKFWQWDSALLHLLNQFLLVGDIQWKPGILDNAEYRET